MPAWKIVKHAIKMLVDNFAVALQISFVLFLIQAGVETLFASLPVASFIVSFVLLSIVSIAWNRFVLLGETPQGFIPPFNKARIWAYIVRNILLLLILVAPLALFGIAIWLMNLRSEEPDFDALFFVTKLFGVILILPLIAVSVRLSCVLPARSLDKKLSFRDAWRATQGSTGTAILSSVMIFIIVTPALLSYFVFAPFLWVQFFPDLIAGWVITMVYNSFATTFYGYYIDGRDLS